MSFDVLWSSAKSTFILFLETPVHKHYTKVRANVFDGRCHHTCQWMTIGLYWSLKLYSLMFQHVSTPLQVTSGGRIISGKRFVRASQNRSSRSWHLQHQQTQRCFNLKETFVRSQHLSKWFNQKKCFRMGMGWHGVANWHASSAPHWYLAKNPKVVAMVPDLEHHSSNVRMANVRISLNSVKTGQGEYWDTRKQVQWMS